jgi:hypothetical protein
MSGLLRNSNRLFAGCSELTYIGVSPDQKTLSRSQLAAAMPAEVVGACRTRSIWKNFRFRCGGRRAVMRTAAKRIELPEISGAPITTPAYMDSIRSGERCLALMKFRARRPGKSAAGAFLRGRSVTSSISRMRRRALPYFDRSDMRDECGSPAAEVIARNVSN